MQVTVGWVRVALFAAAFVCWAACQEPAADAKGLRAKSPRSLSSSARFCGVCYAHNWQQNGKDGYGTATSQRSLDELFALGIRQISITPFGWMKDVRSVDVKWSASWHAAENFQRLRKVIARAKKRKMTVILKPHIWIGNGWRGKIQPDAKAGGWTAWFASYTRFISAYAELAQKTGVDWFVVGVELKTSSKSQQARWRALIRSLRRIYRGKMTYAANWDEVEHIAFWDALDAVGVQMFAPLHSGGSKPTYASVLAAAKRWQKHYEAIGKRFGRPLILTEAGVVNMVGALLRPYVWPERLADKKRTAAGDREQQLGYRAIIETFGRSAKVRQIYWWKWFSNPRTKEEGPVGFSPRGKPAQKLLRSACKK
jgi:hypothetical protein